MEIKDDGIYIPKTNNAEWIPFSKLITNEIAEKVCDKIMSEWGYYESGQMEKGHIKDIWKWCCEELGFSNETKNST